MRVRCPGCGGKVIGGKCAKCGTPPLSNQLKWTLLSLVGVAILAALSFLGGDPIDSGAKKKAEPAASPR